MTDTRNESFGPETAPARYGRLTTDQTGTIIAANERLANWLGLDAFQMTGAPFVEMLTKASRIVFETSIVPLLSLNGHVDGVSLDLKDAEANKLPVLLSAEETGSGEHKVTSFVFLLADARRAYERDLNDARAKAEDRLTTSLHEAQLREQFIAILGHDLRNPLASISSAMSILSREPLSQRSQDIVELTNGSVQRMSLLIQNVLDFARNRLGSGIHLTMTAGTALSAEIRQVVDELRSAQTDREIQLEIGDLDTVRCDVSKVGQLLSNLLGNAVTYGDPSKPIQVRAVKPSANSFELSVKNYGAPIPEAAIARLFDPFVRSTSQEDQQGLGLGLHIASEIAKAYGGSLHVRSDESFTCFTLVIPLSVSD